MKLKEKEIIEKKFKYKCLPIKFNFRNQNDFAVIEKCIRIINNRLNIIRILNKIEIIENLKKENQNNNSYPINNSNLLNNIESKDKESNNINSINASFSSNKVNNFLEEKKK